MSKTTNHIQEVSDSTTCIYPNYHDFEAGQEPAILLKNFSDCLEIRQGDKYILVPIDTCLDFAKTIVNHHKKFK